MNIFIQIIIKIWSLGKMRLDNQNHDYFVSMQSSVIMLLNIAMLLSGMTTL
jgi:hypothetical protein